MTMVVALAPIELASAGSTCAQALSAPPQSVIGALIGGRVFAADGSVVGEIASISVKSNGEIGEVRMIAPSALGLGARIVILPAGSYITLDGAVVVDLSQSEIEALPSATDGQPT